MKQEYLIRKIDELCGAVGIDVYLKGVIWNVSLPEVKARVSAIPSPVLNLVGMADFTKQNVSGGIQTVTDYYRKEGKTFGWLVGQSSRPVNLGERLLAAGFTRVEEESMAGMVLQDLYHPIPQNPDIRVEQVSIAEWDSNVSMMAKAYGFGMTEETVGGIIRFFESMGERTQPYLAYATDSDEPISFSASYYDEGGEVVLLGGAATIEAYRGKGVYSSMVAKRLEDARQKGFTTAVIQAVKGTSAPICAKLGFEAVSEIDFYIYIPSEQAQS